MLRISERVLAVYFAYTSVLASFLPLQPGIRIRTIAVNAFVLSVYILVFRAGRSWPGKWFAIARDWMPLPLMLLAYKEMGWFAPAVHDYHLEQQWIVWDRMVLRDWGLKRAIEAAGPLLPGLLELCYLLVYAVPVYTMATIYVHGRREEADRLLTIYLLGLFFAYAQFPFWPSEPPRTVWPNEDMPAYVTLLRRWSLSVVGGYGIHTSVFPSAHVSGAFAAAFAVRRIVSHKPWIGRGLLIYAVLIAISTVYGRYHFVVDAVAGFAMAVLALHIGEWLLRRARVSPAPSAAPSGE